MTALSSLRSCLDRQPISPHSTATVMQADLREVLSAYDALVASYDERGEVIAALTPVMDVRICARARCVGAA